MRGDFVRIPLPDGTSGYGRLLAEKYVAFHDLHTPAAITDLDVIAATPLRFAQAVRLRDPQRWPVLGHRDLTGPAAEPLVFFTQDVLDPLRCTIFDTTGSSRAAEPHECVGLERAAVWESAGIEQRLLDELSGALNEAELRARVFLTFN